MKLMKKLLLSFRCLIWLSVGSHANVREWLQISPHVEYRRNSYLDGSQKYAQQAEKVAYHRILSEVSVNPSYLHQPLDSSADYDEYQLAWRLLGFYVDCESGGNDGACKRQVLYEYANPYYKGGGIGEYAFYNKTADGWFCYQNSNCITKMDCHEPDTQWKLIGVFKIDNVSEGDGWMEQLFKHQGVCLWGDNTYEFASQMRRSMPNGCKSTKTRLSDGTYLYYAIKPDKEGSITLGLYTDSKCSEEYSGEETYDVFQLSGSDESNWILFNEALNIYKQCQPCMSYDLSVSGFSCDDDAGYTNCNQCMKFSNKAGCKVAGMDDLIHAAKQGGLLNFSVTGVSYDVDSLKQNAAPAMSQHESIPKMHFQIFASLFFCIGLAAFVKTATTEKSERRSIAKTSEHLIEVPEEAHDFKATKTIQRKLLKTMVKSYDNAKMKLIYYNTDGKIYTVKEKDNKKPVSSEDDVVTFIAEDQADAPQESEGTEKKFDLPPAVTKSKKNFLSKFFKKISASVSSADNSHVAVHSVDNSPADNLQVAVPSLDASSADTSNLAVLSVEGPAHETSLGNDLLDDATSISKDTDSRPDDERMASDDHASSVSSHHTALQPSHLSLEENSLPFDETSYRNQVV